MTRTRSPIAIACVFALAASTSGRAAAQVVTTLCSADSNGNLGDGNSGTVSISADGRYAAFFSYAANFVPGGSGIGGQIYRHDLQTAVTELASAIPAGYPGNGNSNIGTSTLSADGRFVVFSSFASNLVANDGNNRQDVFVRDMTAGITTRVSINSNSAQSNDTSVFGSISGDGRYVAFVSWATNLVTGDTNAMPDVFVRDRQTATTIRASVGTGGIQANGASSACAISGDGRSVVFGNTADNLVALDLNHASDVFVRDLTLGVTERVSVGPGGIESNGPSPYMSTAISFDGRGVAFDSSATDLVPGDTNGSPDVFLRDRAAGATSRASVDSNGVQGYDYSQSCALTRDGRFVVFQSYAPNLVVGDANHTSDIFVHDGLTGATTRVSGGSGSFESNGTSFRPATSATERFIAFTSGATNLAAVVDYNMHNDVFVVDLGTAPIVSFCTAGTTSNACIPAIAGAGVPSSSSGSGFTISVLSVEGQRQGFVFYGVDNFGFTAMPWGASYRCVQPPVQRMGAQNTGGTYGVCDGILLVDWNAYVGAHATALGMPFLASQHVFAQAWFRDPPSPKTSNLSDALDFVVVP